MHILPTDQGRERLLIKKGMADEALAHRDKRHEKKVVEKILYDDYQLAQQPFEWFDYAAEVLHSKLPGTNWDINRGRIHAMWKRAVTSHVPTAQREIAATIKAHAILGAPLPAVSLYIVGKGELRLRTCPLPLCFGEYVAYNPADPATFITSMRQRLSRIPPMSKCDHRIPVPLTAQRILENYLETYRQKV